MLMVERVVKIINATFAQNKRLFFFEQKLRTRDGITNVNTPSKCIAEMYTKTSVDNGKK